MESNTGFEIDLRKSLVVLALALVTLAVCRFMPAADAGDDTGVVMDLPYHLGPLYAYSEAVSQAELTILPSDTTFARKTYGVAGSDRLDRILCSIVLSGREKKSIHRPERCLLGQGWTVRNTQVITVPLVSGHLLPVTALLLARPVTLNNGQAATLQSYYLYWYVGKNVSTPYSFERVMLTNWDLIVHRTNQRWAYVIVSANIMQGFRPDGLGPEQTLEMLKAVIRESVPYYVKSEMPADQAGTTSN